MIASILYKIFGMSTFDAIAHSMTSISTGGFSTHDQSFGYFDNNKLNLIAIIYMFIGSIPFILLAQAKWKSLYKIFKDEGFVYKRDNVFSVRILGFVDVNSVESNDSIPLFILFIATIVGILMWTETCKDLVCVYFFLNS